MQSQSSATQSEPSVETVPESPTHKVLRTVSAELARIVGRETGWFDNGKILTEGSPEIKEFRAVLKKQGELLPDMTRLCIHLQKPKTLSKTTGMTFTKQGTLTEHWAQGYLTRLLEKYLIVDKKPVKPGAKHENDHVTLKNAASMSELRHIITAHDRSPTINMTQHAHRIRTDYSRSNPALFDLNNLTAQVRDLFEKTRRADHDFWTNMKNRRDVLADDLKPEFVAKQYDLGHLHDQARMESNLKRRNFNPKQATAFLLNEKLKDAFKLSKNTFSSSRISVPALDEESEKVFSQFDIEQKEEVYQDYAKEIRLFNLVEFTKHRAKCVNLSLLLQFYSESPAGGEDGCTAFQTEQHKETTIEGIKGFTKALDKANIPKAKATKALKDMLKDAHVKRDGTLRKGKLSEQLKGQLTNEQVREELRKRICRVGLDLNINTLYDKGGLFKMSMPLPITQEKYYKQSVENVRKGLIGTSTWTQRESSQWSEAESSDQGSL